ncbi:MAG: M23 family metallopeptidase [Chloroflexota bacterium]|nr:MAG: hypothetical protein KatS3mg045_1703 [Bellilinea sp.]
MSDSPFSPLLPVYSAGRTPQSPALTQPVSSSPGSDFQNLLSVLLASGGGLGSSPATGSDLLTPLLLVLLEQLIARQTEQSPSSGAAASPSLPGGVFTPMETGEPSPLPWGRPVGGRLTQAFHTHHNGLDFGIPVGTPVRSTMDGRVVYAGWNDQGYGNLVIVENGPYRTYYAHLSSIPVSVGQQVRAGTVIGLSGNTGNSTGPHLHYEIRINQKAIDPTDLTLNRPPRW